MLREIVRVNGPAMLCQIGRAGANNLCQVRNLARDEGRVAQGSDPKRDIHVVVDEIDDTICNQELKCDPGISGYEFGQYGREVVDRKGRKRMNPQMSLRRATT